jgi:hypothetical protein
MILKRAKHCLVINLIGLLNPKEVVLPCNTALKAPIPSPSLSSPCAGQIPIDLFPTNLSNFSLVHEAHATTAVSYREALAVIARGLFSSVPKVC